MTESVPGRALLDLVAVMDRLRSPGGCPWDARQTHTSLLRYLVEESYEVVDAVENGTRAELRDELGDLLLQVVFHARVAQEDPEEPFGIDDVAAAIVAKLERRHPHVFAGEAVAEDLQAGWDAIKATEGVRESVLDGIPLQLPALARADKVLGRLQRNGLDAPAAPGEGVDEESVGRELLDLVRRAHAAGVDPEAALRVTTRRLETAARETERHRGAGAAG
ncbi:MazG family protein [Kineococcus radiotolerans]|uniref:MazG family protein n=1 Tax=Kineococcus radiotolerans (strain ATCC BAA-149 / DSM 14245 / SRS30216) TaxID=266940 RepID=A6W6W9_KINRD|nr:MazG family protein [Kineococcus radiotolerans]ABS02558.1 MazG family protein [Kineococcus radiotolerans SRS30216 = ATCC BAA-149]